MKTRVVRWLGSRRGVWIALVLSLSFAPLACGRSSSVAAPPPPAPSPVAEIENLPRNLDEARALRTSGQLDVYERGLQALALSNDPVIQRRSLALLGLFYVDEKRHDDALKTLRSAIGIYPEVAAHLRLRIVAIEELRNRLPEAIREAEQILIEAPSSAAATIATFRLPVLHARAGNKEGTDAAFKRAMQVPIDEFTESELEELASQLLPLGRRDLANAIRMRILRDYPQGRLIETTYAEVAAAPSPLDTLAVEDTLQLAARLGRNNRYDQALDLLERLRSRVPQVAANAGFRAVRLRALFNSRRYTELLAETTESALNDPALLLLRARAAWRSDRPEEFLAGLRSLEKRFPSSGEAREAKVLRAKYYLSDVKEHARSIENLRAAIDGGLVGNDGEHVWTLGWTHFQAGNLDEALRTFDRYLRTYADGDYRTNSLFWSAKIYDRLGQREQRDSKFRRILVEYPYNYYAYRAREIMGDRSLPPGSIAGSTPFPDVQAQLATITDPRLKTVRELAALQLLREASREMKGVVAALPDNLGAAFMLADLYVQAGEPFKANTILQRKFRQYVRHGGSGVPARFWQILYPRNYWETIREEAKKRKVDPYLLTSIIRQESGFEPTIVSNAGAVGLMQIMPHEAPRIASAAGLEGITRDALFDPRRNIAVGAAEYTQKLALMKGDHLLAIAAYNAGEEPVGRWLAQNANQDVDIFVESIPYAETRLYVKTVSRNRFEYRRIYESSTVSKQSQ